jgi:hypothetical protein
LLYCVLITGCSVRGTYVDPSGANTAKLRFVSYASNSTLDYFDSQTCNGRTTGILNNGFLRDADRQVGMKVLPPASARGYLELTIAAEREVVLSLNTLDTYGVSCGVPIKFSFEQNAEYELTLWRHGRRCNATLDRVRAADGNTVRTPQTVSTTTALHACNGLGPGFLSN